jgi:uncharacterized damage-inducible protein DinB
MNDDARRLIEQLQREFDGDPWHGPSLKELLAGVEADLASHRPAGSTHSIWELVLHISGWKREVAARLGGKLASDPAAGDWPQAGEPSAGRWRAVQADLAKAHAELIAAVESLPSVLMHEPVRDERSPASGSGETAWQTIAGVLQHDVYHAGQVAILKKLGGIR